MMFSRAVSACSSGGRGKVHALSIHTTPIYEVEPISFIDNTDVLAFARLLAHIYSHQMFVPGLILCWPTLLKVGKHFFRLLGCSRSIFTTPSLQRSRLPAACISPSGPRTLLTNPGLTWLSLTVCPLILTTRPSRKDFAIPASRLCPSLGVHTICNLLARTRMTLLILEELSLLSPFLHPLTFGPTKCVEI
jgi:hypothetical protein